MNNQDFIKDDEAISNQPDSSFALNQRSFKGHKLNKFTLGHRIILNQVREENDSTEFFIWSTIFSLLKNREEIVSLAWDKNKFRTAVLNWVDTMKADDFQEALTIINSIYDEINMASVEITNKEEDKKK